MRPLPADQFYQISFQVENVGKTVEKSKKRVTWVFGQDTHEYTVTFVWSKHSGKRLVNMTGEEAFFETKKTVTFFHRWTTQDGSMNLHILASSATPSKKFVSPDFIKYELIINGERFVKLPKKDGTPAPEQEPYDGPGSIFDIIFPQGYRDKSVKSEGVYYKSKSSFNKEVSKRIVKQANYAASAGGQ
jgi:hypothetical protein